MADRENPGQQGRDRAAQGRGNRDRPNRGQDENLHTFVNDAGDEVQGTMREFRESLREQGYRKPEDVADEDEATEAES